MKTVQSSRRLTLARAATLGACVLSLCAVPLSMRQVTHAQSSSAALPVTQDRDSHSDNATGTNPTINTSKWSTIYVKFNLASAPANVSSAKLRLYRSENNQGAMTVLAQQSSDGWAENTAGNALPAPGAQVASASSPGIGWVEIDVTSYIASKRASGVASLAIRTDKDGWSTFNAREAGSNAPQLLVAGNTGGGNGPTDDRDSQSDNATGTSPNINASRWSTSYFKFNLSSAPGSINSAKLRVYRAEANQGALTVQAFESPDSWNESTAGAALPASGQQIAATPSGGAGWVELDVSSYIASRRGAGVASIAMRTDKDGWTTFNSRQAAANQPQLIINGSGGPVATATPAPQATATLPPSGNGARVRANMGTNMSFLYFGPDVDNSWTGGDIFVPGVNLATATNPWNPAVLQELKPFQVLRFMDWFGGNSDGQVDWTTNRTRKGDNRQYGPTMNERVSPPGFNEDQVQADGRLTYGVALEWIVDLTNRNGSDLWINVPARTINVDDFPTGVDFNNTYVHKMAVMLKTGVDMRGVDLKQKLRERFNGNADLAQLANVSKADLIAWGGVDTGAAVRSDLKIYVEYANEPWCCGPGNPRPVRQWATAQAVKLGYTDDHNWAKFAGYAEMRSFKAFQDVFGAGAMGSRVIRVSGPVYSWYDKAREVFTNIYDNRAAQANPWGQRFDAWKWASYIGGPSGAGVSDATWNAGVDTDLAGTTNYFNALRANHGVSRFLMYEGGQHFDSNQTAFSNDASTAGKYRYWLDKMDDQFSLIVHYNYYAKWGEPYAWGLTNGVGNAASSPKYNAVKDYVEGR